jgi:hypothetical protein
MMISKAVNFVIRNVNIVREPTTFCSKLTDTLIKYIEIAGVRNVYWDRCGLLPLFRLELLGGAVSPVTGALVEYT